MYLFTFYFCDCTMRIQMLWMFLLKWDRIQTRIVAVLLDFFFFLYLKTHKPWPESLTNCTDPSQVSKLIWRLSFLHMSRRQTCAAPVAWCMCDTQHASHPDLSCPDPSVWCICAPLKHNARVSVTLPLCTCRGRAGTRLPLHRMHGPSR